MGGANLKGTDGVYFVQLSKARTATPPACGAANPNVFVTTPSTASGRAIIATLLAAQAEGRPVYVGGMGFCDLFSQAETINTVVTQ